MILAIEGLDAAGKHTQTTHLVRRATAAGRRVATLAFPRYGETFFAASVADYLNGRFGDLSAVDPRFAALLYAGDRFESRALIERLTHEHDLVVIDRYTASNLAYQGGRAGPERREAMVEWLGRLEHEVYGLPAADVTLFLDVPAALAARMVLKKGKRDYTAEAADLHEKDVAFLEATRSMYLWLAERQVRSRWVRVECAGGDGELLPAEEIAERIWSAVGGAIADR